MLLYIDGVLNASNTNGGNTTTSSLDMRLGSRYTNANYYDGQMDEVAIWDNDQSANITSIFNQGVPSSLESLNPISHWRMGEDATWNGTDWTLTDNGIGGNNGTSQNMVLASRTNDVPE